MRNNAIVKQIQTQYNQAFPMSKNRVNQRNSMVWLNTFIRKSFAANLPTQMFQIGSEVTNVPMVGKFYMFAYYPKTAEKLPYFDTFPFILVLNLEADKMLGINFHYLHPLHRIAIMSEILELSMNPSYQVNSNNKILATYQRLKMLATSAFVKPMIKQYLYSHVRSRLIEIPIDEMGICINLPTERFVKDSMYNVWNKSYTKAKGL